MEPNKWKRSISGLGPSPKETREKKVRREKDLVMLSENLDVDPTTVPEWDLRR